MQTPLAIAIIGAALYLLARGTDVRLALFAAGLGLASVAGKPWVVLDAFQATMGNGEIVGPICSAMAYAFVLKATGSDREMVRMLIAPIRRVRWLLIPGGCAVGFLTNMAVTSQTAVAASVGSVLVPLMLAAGYHPIIVAATLVLGCSGGGNLFNPGEPDVVNIYTSTQAHGSSLVQVLEAMFLPELLGFSAAVAAFTLFSWRVPKVDVEAPPLPDVDETKPLHYGKALLPPLPIAMLFLCQPRFALFPPLLELYPKGLPVPHAMVISTIVALLVSGTKPSAQTKQFFEGMGFGYIHVISLIITASCLIKGMETVGLIDRLVGAIQGGGWLGKVASAVFPWMLAVLSGSGTAPSVAFSQGVLPSVSETDLDGAINLGVLSAIGATFGRTMSPVAAVVVYTSTLLNVPPGQIVRRTAPALALGAVVVLAIMLLR